ncbi:hypothetical protein JHK87_020738 [Glycine soja]|nr:hypothetical protein JHK87_020738 [Glycine soja]
MGAGKGAVWFSNAVALVAIAVVACHAQPSATFKCSSANKPTCRPLISYSNPNTTTLGDIQKLFNVKHIMDIVGANNATKKIYGGPQRDYNVSHPNSNQPTGLLGPLWSAQATSFPPQIPAIAQPAPIPVIIPSAISQQKLQLMICLVVSDCVQTVPPSGSGGSTGSDSGASRSTFQGLLLSNLLIVIHFVLFLVYVL